MRWGRTAADIITVLRYEGRCTAPGLLCARGLCGRERGGEGDCEGGIEGGGGLLRRELWRRDASKDAFRRRTQRKVEGRMKEEEAARDGKGSGCHEVIALRSYRCGCE